MQIWKGTRLSTLLLVYPTCLDVLVEMGPTLDWLKDPERRRLRAHRLSLADVAHRLGRPVEDVIDALKDHLAPV